MTILPVDEINALEERLKVHFEDGADGQPGTGKIKSKQDCEEIIDELFDLFLLAYINGVESVNSSMGTSITQSTEAVRDTLYEKIDGRTWEERVWDYYMNGGTVYDISRIAATEAHRDANEAAYDTARLAGATKKTWHCMMLPTSRDEHIWLDGVSAPIDGYFYSSIGERTQYPGQWGIPEQDVNCLCWLTYE